MSVKDIRKIIADKLEEYAVDKDWYDNFDVELAQAIHDAGYRKLDEMEVNYSFILCAMSRLLSTGYDFAPSFPVLSKQLEKHKSEWLRAK